MLSSTGAQIFLPKRENTKCQLAPLANRRKLQHMLHSWGVPASKGARQARRPRRGPARQRAIAGASSLQRRKREAGTYAEKQTRVEAEPCAADGVILRTKSFSGCGPSLGEWSNTYCECNTRELKQPVCESSAPHATPCPPVRTPCTVSFGIKDTPRLLASTSQRCHHRYQSCQPIRLCVQLRSLL